MTRRETVCIVGAFAGLLVGAVGIWLTPVSAQIGKSTPGLVFDVGVALKWIGLAICVCFIVAGLMSHDKKDD